ncbi:unnamed protein product [Cladocopium goreaui]|uniref:Uncharacterized protein n=1 Tax=Cladocopium goreaui TaxID=2562237 RepID=A0A9P1D5Y4_9DINO|nr:unnamed protein product [Cladocopium goreaui]
MTSSSSSGSSSSSSEDEEEAASEINPQKRKFLEKNIKCERKVAEKVAHFISRNMPGRTYGAPISRRRIYLLMIQESVMTEEAAQQDLSDYIEAKLKAMHFKSSKVRWIDLLLPKQHSAIQKDMKKRSLLRKRAARKPMDFRAKWVKGHTKWAKDNQAVDLLLAQRGQLSIVNTSQSLHQMPYLNSDDEDLMPNGKFLSTTAGRYLIGKEVLHSLAGNAMAMRAVLPLICSALSACEPTKLAM